MSVFPYSVRCFGRNVRVSSRFRPTPRPYTAGGLATYMPNLCRYSSDVMKALTISARTKSPPN
jgi:hypothetical protein